MIETMKRLLIKTTPLKIAAKELLEAQRSLLEAESGLEYAQSMVLYNKKRVTRLHIRLNELKGEQA